LNEALASGQDIVKQYNGVAEQMADQMQNNLAGDVTIFKSAMEGLQIAISDRVTPALRDFVQMGTESVSGLVTAVQNGDWDGAIAIFEDFIRSLIESVTNALPTIIEVGGKLIGAIGQGILDNLDLLLDTSIEIITSLANALVNSDGLQKLLDAAVKVVSVLGEYFLSPESLQSIVESALGIIEQFANTFLNPDSITGIIDAAVNIITALADGLIKAIPELIPAVVEIILSIAEAMTDPQNAAEIIKGAAALIVALAEGLIKAIPVVIEKVPVIVENIVKTFIELAGEFAKAAWEASVSFVNSLVEGIKQNLEQSEIGQSFLRLIEAVKEALDVIWNLFKHSWSILKEGVTFAFTWIKSSLTPFFANIKYALTGFFDVVKAVASTFWDIFKNLFKTGCDVVANIINAFLSAFKLDWEGALNHIVNAVSSWWEGLKNTFRSIFDNVKNLFSEQIENAKNWGRDLLDSFINGITEKIQAVRDTISNVAGIVRDFIGFSEPKRGPLSNFHTYAPDMMDLFAKGIKDNTDTVTKQLEKSLDFSDVLVDQTVNVNGMVSGNMGAVQAAGNTTSYGGITVNVYGSDGQDINELADAVSDRLRHLMDQAGAVYA
jgi:phage-related protein